MSLLDLKEKSNALNDLIHLNSLYLSEGKIKGDIE